MEPNAQTDKPRNNSGKFAVIGFVTMTIISIGVLFLFKNASLPRISALPVMDTIGGEFELPSSLDKPVKLSDFSGTVLMINFGFTSCPDVCPTILSRLAKISKILKKQRGFDKTKLQTLFITTDPERDDANQLAQYLTHFHPDFIGLTGSAEAIKQVAKQYGVYYQKDTSTQTPADNETANYNMSHTDKIYLLDKLGRIRKLYSAENSLDEIILDIRGLVAEIHPSLDQAPLKSEVQ